MFSQQVRLLTNIDFPLPFQINIENPIATAEIKIFQKTTDTESILIDTIAPVDTEIVRGEWPETPPSGSYQVYAEATTWQQSKAESDPS